MDQFEPRFGPEPDIYAMRTVYISEATTLLERIRWGDTDYTLEDLNTAITNLREVLDSLLAPKPLAPGEMRIGTGPEWA